MKPQRKYVGATDVAKLIRQALKEALPGVKFSVRTKQYSGGASINIGWIDGPSESLVTAVVGRFEGAYFDGMIDYKGTNYISLDGEECYFGADFIFCNREYSPALKLKVLKAFSNKWGGILENFGTFDAALEAWDTGKLWNMPISGCYCLSTELNKLLGKRSDRLALSPSPTMERVAFVGDDGYGGGTVGDGGGVTCKGYPSDTPKPAPDLPTAAEIDAVASTYEKAGCDRATLDRAAVKLNGAVVIDLMKLVN